MNVEEFQKNVLELLAEVELSTTDDVMDVRAIGSAMTYQMDDVLMRLMGQDGMPPDGQLAAAVMSFYKGAMYLTHDYLPNEGCWQEFLLAFSNLVARKALSGASDMDVELAIRGVSGTLAALIINLTVRQWHPTMSVDKLVANGKVLEGAILDVVAEELKKHDKESGLRN
jgi:hypothetical protein